MRTAKAEQLEESAQPSKKKKRKGRGHRSPPPPHRSSPGHGARTDRQPWIEGAATTVQLSPAHPSASKWLLSLVTPLSVRSHVPPPEVEGSAWREEVESAWFWSNSGAPLTFSPLASCAPLWREDDSAWHRFYLPKRRAFLADSLLPLPWNRYLGACRIEGMEYIQ